MTRYLELDDILRIVERLGFHIRDAGLLSSAIARPATTIGGAAVYRSVEMKAAALLDSLVRHHPLVDGNKRLGWTATVVFVWINGYRHDMDADTAFDLVLGVSRGELGLDDTAAALQRHLVPR